jgi:tetratricopeptide (TPR) repeat protein
MKGFWLAICLYVLWSPVAQATAPATVENLLHGGRVFEALEAAELELKERPDDLDVHELYIDILRTLGLAHRARAIYSGRITKDPTAADAHYLFGRAVLSADEAKAAYEKALSLESEHARSHMGMAAVELAAGQVAKAIAGYQAAAEANPKLSEAWQGWARSLVLQQQAEEALSVARRAMVAVPNEAEPYLTVAVLKPTEAIKVLTKATRMAPHDPRPHARLAELYIESGQATAAIASAKGALAIDPILPDASRSLMFAEAIKTGALDREGYRALLDAQSKMRGSTDFGYASFDALVKAYPSCALTWMGRSQSRLRLNHVDGAWADLEQAVKLDPENPEIQAAFGLISLKAKRLSHAVRWLRKAQERRPRDISVLVALGQALALAGEVEVGIDVLQKGFARFPYEPRVTLAYAEVLANKGEVLAAYEVLREAFQRRPDGRVLVSLIAATRDVGRYGEAASLLEKLGKQTGSTVLLEEASKLRALMKAQEAGAAGEGR